MIDVSDGLAVDLGHILESSRVGAYIYEDLIPRTRGANLQQALGDGEDFELLFTLPVEKARRLPRMKQRRFHFYEIGKIVDRKEKLKLINSTGKEKTLEAKGFRHF